MNMELTIILILLNIINLKTNYRVTKKIEEIVIVLVN